MKRIELDGSWALLIAENQEETNALSVHTEADASRGPGVALQHRDSGALFRAATESGCLADCLDDLIGRSPGDAEPTAAEIIAAAAAGLIRAKGAIHGLPGTSPTGALMM